VQRLASVLSTDAARELGLGGFWQELDGLRAVQATARNIRALERACSALESQIDAAVQGHSSVRKIFQEYVEARKRFQSLGRIENRFPGSIPDGTLKGFSERLASLGKYFGGKGLMVERALPLLPEISSRLALLREDLGAAAAKAAGGALAETFSFVVIPRGTPVLGESTDAIVRVLLENPFGFGVEFPFEVWLPLGMEVRGLARAPPNVLFARSSGDMVLVSLSGLPAGITVVDLNSMVSASFEEETELLDVDQFQAVFEKTIYVDAVPSLPKLLVKTRLFPESGLSVENVEVYSAGQPLAFSREGNAVSFVLEHPGEKQDIKLYFAVKGPLGTETELLDAGRITQRERSYQLKLTVLNRLPLPLEKVRVKMPLDVNGNSVRVMEFVDSSGKGVKFEVLSGKNLAIWLDSLFPGQKRQLYLSLVVEDVEEYWLSQLETQRARALSLAGSGGAGVRESAGVLLENLSFFGEKFFESEKEISELSEITQRLDKLDAENERIYAAKRRFALLRDSLLDELRALEENASVLSSLGLGEGAAKAAGSAGRVREALSKAEAMLESGRIDEALAKLSAAQGLLPARLDATITGFFAEKKSRLVERLGGLLAKARALGLGEYAPLEKNVLLMAADVESEISGGEYTKSRELLDGMEREVRAMERELGAAAQGKARGLVERVGRLNTVVGSTLPSLFARLKRILGGATEEELTAARYVPPTSFFGLKKLASKLEGLEGLSPSEGFDRFLSLYREGKHLDALSLAQGFSEELDEKEEKALALEREATEAIQQLEEDALASYNATVQLFSRTSGNALASEALAKSEESLKRGDFLRSIVQSKRAALLVSKPGPRWSFPVYLLPVFAAALLVLAVRIRGRSGGTTKARKLKRVKGSWPKGY
jgi:hypothetical protein